MGEQKQADGRETMCLLTGFTLDIDQDETGNGRLTELTKLIYDHMQKLVYSKQMEKFLDAKFLGVNGFGLDPESTNCRQCERCNCWATDINEENELAFLPIGREVESQFICIQCEDAPNM